MPSKSRRKRGKNLPPGKRKKDRVNATPASIIPETPQDTESVPIPEATVPSEKTTMPSPKTQAIRYPYITKELWTIGGLGVLMIIILIILAASV